VHADATIALPMLVTALAHSSGERVKRRRRPTFDPSQRDMLVEGVPVSRDAFGEKGH
jgi:hypothetical protein